MSTRAASGTYWLLLLSTLIPGVQLQVNDSSVQSSSVRIYRPVLQPSESIPPPATYMLKTLTGKPCIKATLGAEFIIVDKKMWYWSLDPSRVRTSGYCGNEVAVLSLTMPNNAASLQFFFKKEKKVFYVTKLTAHVSPLPLCKDCTNLTYAGLVDHEKLFETEDGRSFKCNSESVFHLSSVLRVKLEPLQIQAFTLTKGQYGQEVECWADYNKRVIPIIVGATVVGLILIAAVTYLIIRDRRRSGYESL